MFKVCSRCGQEYQAWVTECSDCGVPLDLAPGETLAPETRPAAPIEVGQWHAVLRSASGYHAFRRIHSSDLTPARVAAFLLFNPAFPRSVHLCLREVQNALSELKSRYALRGGNDVSEGLDQLRTILGARSIEEIGRASCRERVWIPV